MTNIVLCFDGTGGTVRATGNSNVVRLFEMLSNDDKQLTYYDPGVGTFSSGGTWTPAAQWLSRAFGLLFGAGMRTQLEEAYAFLINHWKPYDDIFIFGFSRGAYCARALTGLLHLIGVMRPGSDNLVQYAVSNYAREKPKWRNNEWQQAHEFARAMSRHVDGHTSVPVKYLGIWDTVKAPGVLARSMEWPYTRQLPNVAAGRHAVAIDEKRRPFREYLVNQKEGHKTIEEVWFAGVHSDIGGGYEDEPRLGDIALVWMTKGAQDAGLSTRDDRPLPILTPAHATAQIHQKMDWYWSLLIDKRRTLPTAAKVHDSVRQRIAAQPDYAKRIPHDVTFVDPQWADATPASTR
jgi:uncharacterized protein (DUF2235 family)